MSNPWANIGGVFETMEPRLYEITQLAGGPKRIIYLSTYHTGIMVHIYYLLHIYIPHM